MKLISTSEKKNHYLIIAEIGQDLGNQLHCTNIFDELTVAQLFVIHYLLRKPEFHNRADKSGPVGTIQSHTNPIHSLTLNPS